MIASGAVYVTNILLMALAALRLFITILYGMELPLLVSWVNIVMAVRGIIMYSIMHDVALWMSSRFAELVPTV